MSEITNNKQQTNKQQTNINKKKQANKQTKKYKRTNKNTKKQKKIQTNKQKYKETKKKYKQTNNEELCQRTRALKHVWEKKYLNYDVPVQKDARGRSEICICGQKRRRGKKATAPRG